MELFTSYLYDLDYQPIEEFDPDAGIPEEISLIGQGLRVRVDYDDDESSLTDQLEALAADPLADQLKTIVIGLWNDAYNNGPDAPIATLLDLKEQFPRLKTIFLGDIIYSDLEVSWIKQTDISPLLDGFPDLEKLFIRGSTGLAFEDANHDSLKKLVIQSGGLGRDVIAQVIDSHLPALEHLELWMGTEWYGGDSSVEDVMPILSGKVFPSLASLGLCNSEYTDDIAEALLGAPVCEQITRLDLSRGILTDEGAEHLLENSALTDLEELDVSKNYLSDDMIDQIEEEFPDTCEIHAFDQKGPEEYEEDRYCSVRE